LLCKRIGCVDQEKQHKLRRGETREEKTTLNHKNGKYSRTGRKKEIIRIMKGGQFWDPKKGKGEDKTSFRAMREKNVCLNRQKQIAGVTQIPIAGSYVCWENHDQKHVNPRGRLVAEARSISLETNRKTNGVW